ncbi:MAG: 3'(2'),5'-bisphosphate nucleotidase CysQ [Nanoarchaeota archaeon]|nr:3'(2'),5'-bisphosphate nucleotidase CysQ [Nanoarchaeota archaeon]
MRDYSKELSVALNLVKMAGEEIMKSFKKNKIVETKEDGSLVTCADIESNRIILKGLKEHFPDDAIVSEEFPNKTRGRREWHIDPLDGTGSFVFGSDEFSIQVGFCENGKPVLGVVFRPVTGEIYYGVKNCGSYKICKNGDKVLLHVTNTKPENLVAVISYNEKTQLETEKILKEVGIKNYFKFGGAGLKIISITENKADIFFTVVTNSNTWDFCAPQIILEEAGGIVEYVDGEEVFYANITRFPKNLVFGKTKEQIRLIQNYFLRINSF